MLVSCGGPTAADTRSAAPSAAQREPTTRPSSAAGDRPASESTGAGDPTELTDAHARSIADGVAATDSFLDLDEYSHETYDVGTGEVCGRDVPGAGEELVDESRVFYSEDLPLDDEGAEVHQSTTVYRTEAAAAEAFAQAMDILERCERIRHDESGQVIRGFRRATVPDGIALDGRAITATMTVRPSGDRFAYRHGCVRGGPVVQCVTVYAVGKRTGGRWFDRALTRTAEQLSAHVDV